MSAFSIAVFDKLIQPLKKPAASMAETPPAEGDPPFSFYPPLYVTPPVEPRRPSSPSPSSPSSSPYVVNFKRRGPLPSARMQNNADECTVGRDLSESNENARNNKSMRASSQTEDMAHAADDRNPSHDLSSSGYKPSVEASCDAWEIQSETDIARYYENREEAILGSDMSELAPGRHDDAEMAIAQSTESKPRLILADGTKSGTSLEIFSSPRLSTCEEFYDAPEVPLVDSTSEEDSSSAIVTLKRLGMSAQELGSRLQEETARRIRAEEALALLQQRWNEASQKCALIGISLTANEDTVDTRGANMHSVYEHFSERLAVARLVAGAVARAATRAAMDEELEGIITSKNWEISRLWDKLQYVELVNREMSQRNQEVFEVAQRRRRRRKRRQKWLIGCFGSALCLGTAGLLCYKLVPWNEAGTWSKSLNGSTQD